MVNFIIINYLYKNKNKLPPHNIFFTSECFENISRAVILFIIVTIFVIDNIGTLCTKKSTGSKSFPISMKYISYLSLISKHIVSPHRGRGIIPEEIKTLNLKVFFLLDLNI